MMADSGQAEAGLSHAVLCTEGQGRAMGAKDTRGMVV